MMFSASELFSLVVAAELSARLPRVGTACRRSD
jgi:hypothetical protein